MICPRLDRVVQDAGWWKYQLIGIIWFTLHVPNDRRMQKKIFKVSKMWLDKKNLSIFTTV